MTLLGLDGLEWRIKQNWRSATISLMSLTQLNGTLDAILYMQLKVWCVHCNIHWLCSFNIILSHNKGYNYALELNGDYKIAASIYWNKIVVSIHSHLFDIYNRIELQYFTLKLNILSAIYERLFIELFYFCFDSRELIHNSNQ